MSFLFLQRIDAVPLIGNGLNPELNRWLATLVDTLNTTIQEVQDALNALNQYGLTAPSFTTTQITALAVDAPNGTMWYDQTTNNLKAKINGIVVIIV